MIRKRVFAIIVAIVMLGATIIPANAANTASEDYILHDKHNGKKVAVAHYTLAYNPGMECVRATNAISYVTGNIIASQRNFPGYIYLFVSLSAGNYEDWGSASLDTSGDYAEFHLTDYYIPAGKTLSSASAYFETNYDVDGLYANGNYTSVYTSQDLVIP